MNPLTKEQVQAVEKHVKEFDEHWPYPSNVLLELLRGYRAYLEELKHHEENKDADTYIYNLTGNKNFKDSGAYHCARLAALQGEVTTTREVVG